MHKSIDPLPSSGSRRAPPAPAPEQIDLISQAQDQTPPNVEDAMAELSQDLDQAATLTEQRGKHYGHPYDRFSCEATMYEAWRNARIKSLVSGEGVEIPENLEKCLDHSVRWIIDNLARLTHDPLHKDSWADIPGYVRTFEMARSRAADEFLSELGR